MPRTFNIQKTHVRNKIIINYLEIFYLRLIVHGLSTAEISEFLELDITKVYTLKSRISTKFQTENWTKIITQAFKQGHLNKLDFIEDIIKQEALKQTQVLFDIYIKIDKPTLSFQDLKNAILEFYYQAELQMSNMYDNKDANDKLTVKETAFLKLKYKGVPNSEISKRLNITNKELKQIKKDIFKKLSVNNWFNVFKKALQINVLEKSKNHSSNIDLKISDSANRMVRIKKLRRLELNEKKLAIYTEFLELYISIEFNNLFNEQV